MTHRLYFSIKQYKVLNKKFKTVHLQTAEGINANARYMVIYNKIRYIQKSVNQEYDKTTN